MIYIILSIVLFISREATGITVTETVYEGAPHYIIETKTASYWYDRQGGGFSRMIDNDGNDWIAFKREPWNNNPASAASSYRGIPNLVFRGDDSGCGHPGWNMCESIFEPPDKIRTVSKSGRWEWTWTFYEDKAVMEVLRSDPERTYWFLYEGPPGGSFDPADSYWMNSPGGSDTLSEKPDHIKGQRLTGDWDWAAFGTVKQEILLRIVHLTPDNQTDSFSYMGNSEKGISADDGMVVFGFGRTADTRPLLTGNHIFEIGFVPIRKIISRNGQKKLL